MRLSLEQSQLTATFEPSAGVRSSLIGWVNVLSSNLFTVLMIASAENGLTSTAGDTNPPQVK
jgi:hypothetical protein